jgi:6-phosphogluconolactonase
VAVDPSGRFVYVANAGPNAGFNGIPGDVSAYTINGGTGALTLVPGSPFPAGQRPQSVAVDPTGRFVYVANAGLNGNGVSAYTINGGTGALAAVPGPPSLIGTPHLVAMDPKGPFVYVIGSDNPIVSYINAYSIDGTTGALTPVQGSPFLGSGGEVGSAVDPTGRFLYVTNVTQPGPFGSFISAYTIDGTTGALTEVPGSFPVDTAGPVTVHPAGRFLYTQGNTTNIGAGSVVVYTIDSTTGALTAIPGYVFRTWGQPISITIDPTGRFLYTANQVSNSVNAYTIDSTGALRVVLGLPYWAPFPAGLFPSGITSTAGPAPPAPAASGTNQPAS